MAIFIATRSCLLPESSDAHAPFNTMDLGLHMDMPESSTAGDSSTSKDWDQWGEEPTIELFMVQIRWMSPSHTHYPVLIGATGKLYLSLYQRCAEAVLHPRLSTEIDALLDHPLPQVADHEPPILFHPAGRCPHLSYHHSGSETTRQGRRA